MNLLAKHGVVSRSFPHFILCFIELRLDQKLLFCLFTEHRRQQLGVLPDLLQLSGELPLIVDRLLELGLIHGPELLGVLFLNRVLTGQLLDFSLSVFFAP